jgi:oxygen-independent coproporphyrinogen-3 oxidase
MKETGLYIHVPFCRRKCLYCDFFSGGASVADWNAYTEAVIEELRQRVDELTATPSTLYIGGGTPSLLPPESFMRLIENICELTGKKDSWEEFTIEVNPDDVTPELCAMWRGCGVNRVSMGMQSFDDEELRIIGRRHDSAGGIRAYNILRSNFSNVSIDLMFGLPRQTLDSWRMTVERAISLQPEHISAYSLMFEEGTAMTVLRKEGRLSFPTDDECAKMWEMLSYMLKRAGYRQYEISNYSLPGYESKHNSRYWTSNPYLGLGPSAHSYDGDRVRRSNPTDLRGYLAHYTGSSPEGRWYEEECLGDEELMEEYVMLRMRMRIGADLNHYTERFGAEAASRLKRNAGRHIKDGSLEIADGHIRLTDSGVMIADQLILDLLM